MKHDKFAFWLSVPLGFLVVIFMTTCAPSIETLDDKIQFRHERVALALESNIPVLKLKGELEEEMKRAQDIAISAKGIEQLYFDEASGEKILNEVFEISVARPSDLVGDIDCGSWRMLPSRYIQLRTERHGGGDRGCEK